MKPYVQRQMFLFFRGWGLRSRIVLITIVLPTVLFLLGSSRPLKSGGKRVDQDVSLMLPELVAHLEWHYEEDVLDYGCGDGRNGNAMILPEVIKWNSRLFSVDLVESNVELAKTHYPHERVTYGQGSLLDPQGTYSDFPWRYRQFDKIFAIYVFHLIHDLPAALTRFHKALKPGGQLAFTSLTLQGWGFEVCLRLSKMSKWSPYMHKYETTFHPTWAKFRDNSEGVSAVRRMLEDAKFEVGHLRVDEFKVFSYDIRNYLARFAMLTPALSKISKDKLPELREDIKHLFSQITGIPSDAQGFNITYQYIVGVARRKT